MKKISDILLRVFSIGVLCILFAGGLSVLGFLFAMFLGGEVAVLICEFIHKQYFPWVIKFATMFVGCGLVGMYLQKDKALSIEREKKESE